jgi:hypothetical protein
MFEVVGQDGQTDDGKPFFRIPVDGDVAPQGDSRPATVRLRNREYVAVFTPSFRVYGTARRPAPEPKHRLIQLLIKKGVLTEEEWRRANQP